MIGKFWFVRFEAPDCNVVTHSGLTKSEAIRWFNFFMDLGWVVCYGMEVHNG